MKRIDQTRNKDIRDRTMIKDVTRHQKEEMDMGRAHYEKNRW